MRKVLLTGAGAPGGPGILKALLRAGYHVTTADCNDKASGRFLHSNFVQIPKANDSDFVSFLLDYCRRQNITVLLPLVTNELLPLSLHRAQFKEIGVEVIVSNADYLKTANDKGLLYQHLQTKKIAVPSFHLANSVDEVKKAAKHLGYPHHAVCAKPTRSNGSRGVRILQEEIDEYELLFYHKPNHLYTTLERFCDALGSKDFPTLLVSEYLPGDEFSVDCLVQNGTPKLILPRRREKMNGGISIQGTFEKNDPIISYSKEVLSSLNLSGPIGLQVKQNSEGMFRLLEINPRLQGTSVAAMGLGINLPALAIEQAFDEIKIDPDSIAWGTSFVRYYSEVFYK